VSGLPRLRGPSLSRVLRGVLRAPLPGPAGRVVGHQRPRGHPHVPELGLPGTATDLLGRAGGGGRMNPVIDVHVGAGAERRLADDVLDGLTKPFKEIPPKHFYDARGSELFDRICELPEYYPTRAEREILETQAGAIAERTGATELVELGSGTAAKTRVLLDALTTAGTLRRYVPLD